MQRKNPKMTSTEAAALIASNGQTTDVEEANMIADGSLLDPDKLVRAYYRRELGFDLTVSGDDKARKWVVTDEELQNKVTAPMSENPVPETATAEDAQYIARAVMRLKRKHDKTVKEQA